MTNVAFETTMRAAPTLAANSGYNSDSGSLQVINAADYTSWVDGCNIDYTSTTSVTIRGGNTSAYHWIRGRVHLVSEL